VWQKVHGHAPIPGGEGINVANAPRRGQIPSKGPGNGILPFQGGGNHHGAARHKKKSLTGSGSAGVVVVGVRSAEKGDRDNA